MSATLIEWGGGGALRLIVYLLAHLVPENPQLTFNFRIDSRTRDSARKQLQFPSLALLVWVHIPVMMMDKGVPGRTRRSK